MVLRCLLSRAAILSAGLLLFQSAPQQAQAAEDISFSVQTLREENVEGPNVERTFFRVLEKRMAFGLPKGVRLITDGGGFLLLLTDAKLDGEIRVSRSPFKPETGLASDALQYRENAEKAFPEGATNIQAESPVMNIFPYNGWKSLSFTWTYGHFGRSMVRTVTYINLELGIQIMVTTLAETKDAKKVMEIAQQFLSSWWVMKDS